MKTLIPFFLLLFTSATISAQNQADEQAIRKIVQNLADGWTHGNGAEFAGSFADTHDFIVWNGYYMKNLNPQVNASSHQGLFDTRYKDTRMYSTIDKIKFVREDVALIHVLAAVVNKTESRPKDPEVLWTGILEKNNGQWKIISFHNLDLEIFQDEQMRASAPMPAEVMYASWYSEAR